MYWETGPPSNREDAIDQLRYRSKALGGNGIANLACTEEGLQSFQELLQFREV